MLDNIRIKNLRSLEDTGDIRISPIMILLGENSSGKSTFLRSFPLLKQSVEASTRSSILWYGRYVDYGDFDQALSRNSSNGEISFRFGLSLPYALFTGGSPFQKTNIRVPENDETANVSVEIRLASRGKDGLTRTSGLQISIDDNHIDISFNEQGKISSIIINGRDCTHFAELFNYSPSARLLPNINTKVEGSTNQIMGRWRLKLPPEKIHQQILREILTFTHGRTTEKSLDSIYSRLTVGSKKEMLRRFKKASPTDTWQKRTSEIDDNDETYSIIRDLLILSNLPLLVSDIDEVLETSFRRVSYTAPIRASAERYYRSQDLSVNEIDYKGENLAMFVRNLTDRDKQSLDQWVRKEFGFKLDIKYSGGHVTAVIEYEDSGESFNLTDMGFGFSQVMPIIVQIWSLTNKPQRTINGRFAYTYLIEQPELHLHPRLQAKLAEVLANAVKKAQENNIRIKLIFETHSEAIVNKLGLMIAKGEIKSDDISVVIFSKINERSGTKVSVSEFDDEGILHNWPHGFFDIEI